MVGALREEFKLSDFWIKAKKGEEFNPEDVKAFIRECVPFSFEDPHEHHVWLICKSEKEFVKARRFRQRAHYGAPFPDKSMLINFQSWYEIWVRPHEGDEDPLGLWLLLSWMHSCYRIEIFDKEANKYIG